MPFSPIPAGLKANVRFNQDACPVYQAPGQLRTILHSIVLVFSPLTRNRISCATPMLGDTSEEEAQQPKGKDPKRMTAGRKGGLRRGLNMRVLKRVIKDYSCVRVTRTLISSSLPALCRSEEEIAG